MSELSRHTRHRRHGPPKSPRAFNAARARRFVEEGQYRKASQALTSHGLAVPDEDSLEVMLQKHPQVPPPDLPNSPPPAAPSLSKSVVKRAVTSFSPGTAPGPSGLRASHLAEAISCPTPSRAQASLSTLSQFSSLLASGNVPPEVVSHLCGATLLASKKKDGGLRPIAIGETLRQLVSKCLAFSVRHLAASTLLPLQVGVGTKGGAEAAVHAINLIQNDHSIPSDGKWCLLLDFNNAFNSTDRSHLFSVTRDRMPALSAWLECCYGARPLLLFGDHSISSCSGVQQGDPLGFSLTLQPIIERIQSEVPTLLLNNWYLDDGTLCGSALDLERALSIIEEEGPARGLRLNRTKSLLYIPPDSDPDFNCLPPEIPTTSDGFVLLGSPVGPPSFCDSVVQRRISKIQELLQFLPDLEDAQMEYVLLRSCLSFPKFAFAVRTCPPHVLRQSIPLFDSVIHGYLSHLLGGCPPPWSLLKASLPIAMGGLGLRRASLHGPAAFLWSVAPTRNLVQQISNHSFSDDTLVPVFQSLSSSVGHYDWSKLDDFDFPISQQALSHAIDQYSSESLLAQAPDSRHHALVLSTSIPHSGDWLKAIPSSALNLHFFDREFRICLQYWPGVPLTSSSHSCFICTRPCDPLGDHAVGCGGNGDRILCHNALRDVLHSVAQSAGLSPRTEVPALIPNSSSCPADLFLPHWQGGRPAAADVTVISPMQVLTLQGASTSQGSAIVVAEERKKTLYSDACHSEGISFLPLAVETLGGWGSEALSFIKHLARLQALRLDLDQAVSSNHLLQRLSVCLWRHNATMWTSRLPISPPSVDGVL